MLIETPTNPFLKVTDIAALASLAHDKGTILAVDNTVLSPTYGPPFVRDLEGGRRYGTLEDFCNFVINFI